MQISVNISCLEGSFQFKYVIMSQDYCALNYHTLTVRVHFFPRFPESQVLFCALRHLTTAAAELCGVSGLFDCCPASWVLSVALCWLMQGLPRSFWDSRSALKALVKLG